MFEPILTLSWQMVVFWVLTGSLIILLFYYFRFFIRLALYKSKPVAEVLPPVSVIICARNEDDNLPKYLPAVLSQDYPDFEVVVVNDCSLDNTGDILEEFAKKNPHLKIVTIKEDEYYQHGKKVAVMMGIKGAKHEHLVLTDADCVPASDQWLKQMASGFQSEKEIVLGYGPYKRTEGFLNRLIRFDAVMIAIQYLSYSLAGRTYMGVGRNLAYKKSLFYKKKGFASHYHIASGDDDLFVNEAATRKNAAVVLNKEAITYSDAKTTWKDWWRQKKRHQSSGKRYKALHKFLLGLYYLAQVIFYASFVVLLSVKFMWIVVLSVFAFRLLIQMLIFNSCMKRLGDRDLLVFVPIMEVFFLFFYPALSIAGLFRRKHPWNRWN